MADEKLNTSPAENISPEAAEPIATPEQAAASEPQQEQTGPAIPEPGDVVVSFDKINELITSDEVVDNGRDCCKSLRIDCRTHNSDTVILSPKRKLHLTIL